MACFPQDPNGYCYEGVGSLSQMYNEGGGTGEECGYVQFPPEGKDDKKLSPGALAAIVLTPLVLVIVLGIAWHMRQLKQQEKRMKKRFIQQLARNIDIGPSAREISADKLAQTFKHIGGEKNLISKQDLARWLNDLNLDFLSEEDFDRLWHTMDIDNRGTIDPLEFCAFLKECEKQFEEVHNEYSALPKSERVKLATRRLSNIDAVGEEEVEKMERRNNKRRRQCVHSPAGGSNLWISSASTATTFAEPSVQSLRSFFGRKNST